MATYKQIIAFIREKYGYTVKTCWIAHMKELAGLEVKMAHNRYEPSVRTNPCPADKRDAILDAFRYFGMLS